MPEAHGHLAIREALPDGPIGIEGSVPHLGITRVGTGEVIASGPRRRRANGKLFTRDLPSGEYRIVSYQPPCAGNCGYLDPPVARCAARIRLEPSGDLTLTSILRGGPGRCRIVER